MKNRYRIGDWPAKLAVCLSFMLLISVQASAQQTASELKGSVLSSDGSALSGASVSISNNSGISRNVTANASGQFIARNLPIGSDYTVGVSHSGHASRQYNDIKINLGKVTQIEFVLEAAVASLPVGDMETISVVGASLNSTEVAAGPSASFGLDAIESTPSVNRDIKDILRTDSRIYIDEADRGQVQCAGKNPRFNSFTVDGVRMNDSFGLNGNGYPTERMPFSFDAIEQVSVELAPFDVEYGGFTACNINAVTKSGTNEIHGSVFYDFVDDGLRGDSLEGDKLSTGKFEEKRYGLNIGGPIIQDKLFFFIAAEKLEGANLFDRGAIGTGAVNEVDVTQGELDEIAQISRDIYQYDPGGIPQSEPNDDEKLLIKLDWYISEQHRASFNYTYNDGFNVVGSDRDSFEIEFANHNYVRSGELKSTVATLYSDWSDSFSTEIRIGHLDLDNGQNSVGGTDFGEIRVELDNIDVYLGGDDSRQSNDLDYTTDTFALKGKYFTGKHALSFGIEREEFDLFNLFVQHTETEIRFDGIDNFRLGFADRIDYNNAPSQNPLDAAAVWGFAQNTIYLQDKIQVNDRLEVIAGFRYDRYSTSDRPAQNAAFTAEYGFSNSNTLDGEGLFQPRFAFVYDYSDKTTLTGGIGLYSGGNPNVWLSNSFSANNVLQFGQRGRSFGLTDGSRSLLGPDVVYGLLEEGVPNGPGYGVPTELIDAVAAGVGSNFEINYLDPNFELPSEWKIALGGQHLTDAGYFWDANLLLSISQDAAIIKHGDLDQVGTTAEGYPIYDSVRAASFVLMNSSKDASSLGASISVSKEHDNGINWTLGYAYSDTKDIQPMTSSVAFSNYTNRSFFDPQEEVASTSNYNIEHRITLNGKLEKYFFGDNRTTFSVFGSYNSGRPYSRGFDGTINPFGFTPFLDFADNVLRPGVKRNGESGPSWTTMDIKIEQEFRGFRDDDKASAFITIANFTNLLNDEWGCYLKKPCSQGWLMRMRTHP